MGYLIVQMIYMTLPTFTLLNGVKIPALGFGTGTKWKIQKRDDRPAETRHDFVPEIANQVNAAINLGFLHIDTAEAYTTAPEVSAGIKESGFDRSKIFLTDKYQPKSMGPYESLTKNLEILGFDYVDLYLLHFPPDGDSVVSLEESWLQVEKLYKEGRARAIGVSNFSIKHLERIKKVSTITPMVNQIEFNAYLQEQSPGITTYCKANEIQIEAYSPLGPLFRGAPGPLDSILPSLAKKYNKTETQILLRWVYEKGFVVLTTSAKIDRLQDALGIFTFKLDSLDHQKITDIGRTKIHRAFFHRFYDKYNDVLYSV